MPQRHAIGHGQTISNTKVPATNDFSRRQYGGDRQPMMVFPYERSRDKSEIKPQMNNVQRDLSMYFTVDNVFGSSWIFLIQESIENGPEVEKVVYLLCVSLTI